MTEEEVRAVLARVDATNARLAERTARREADGSAAEERYQERYAERQRQQERAAEPPPVVGRNWAQEQRRLEATIDQRVGAATRKWIKEHGNAQLQRFGGSLGEEIGKITKAERDETRQEIAAAEQRLADRLTRSEEATVSLLLEIERRLGELEQRAVLQPTKPRLVAGGGSDAA